MARPATPTTSSANGCGYDFITGSLPSAPQDSLESSCCRERRQRAPPTLRSPQVLPLICLRCQSLVDPSASSHSQGQGQGVGRRGVLSGDGYRGRGVTCPIRCRLKHELELFGEELHIGRTSDNRGVHPNIDIEALTLVIRRSPPKHAVLRVALGRVAHHHRRSGRPMVPSSTISVESR